ncbi:hypothetical protein KIN20_004376 [Parelaphostrongylus tenuis]|uniref:Uncharacterized protein n=1 Tax=Parelaphostrongylus tenuis TaxID=148309 RepID=A0AAD5MGY3_PARTN|nr:hypothetical protein KIN20_004376 [Parelaphostrongylus tenuis]
MRQIVSFFAAQEEITFNMKRYVTTHTCLPWTLTEKDNKLFVDEVQPGFGTGFDSGKEFLVNKGAFQLNTSPIFITTSHRSTLHVVLITAVISLTITNHVSTIAHQHTLDMDSPTTPRPLHKEQLLRGATIIHHTLFVQRQTLHLLPLTTT